MSVGVKIRVENNDMLISILSYSRNPVKHSA